MPSQARAPSSWRLGCKPPSSWSPQNVTSHCLPMLVPTRGLQHASHYRRYLSVWIRSPIQLSYVNSLSNLRPMANADSHLAYGMPSSPFLMVQGFAPLIDQHGFFLPESCAGALTRASEAYDTGLETTISRRKSLKTCSKEPVPRVASSRPGHPASPRCTPSSHNDVLRRPQSGPCHNRITPRRASPVPRMSLMSQM